MPRSLLIILVVCIGFGTESLAGGSGSFTGLWDASNGDVSDFSLDLVQTGNRIEGYHTSIADHSKRIDAVERSEGTPSITGTVSGGVAHVRFQSGYDVLVLVYLQQPWAVFRESALDLCKFLFQLQISDRRK
jgi:hypothetical protein